MPPKVGDDFEWVQASWGPMLRARALSRVSHGWTTRQLALRGSAEQEQAGWDGIAHAVELDRDHLVRLRQVHGAEVHVADATLVPTPPSADIVFTERVDRVVAVQVADCAPILAASDDGRVVAASHAGWRGTAADVAGVTVRSFEQRFNVRPAEVSAAIGPSIGPCCYEVGAELIDAFAARGWNRSELESWFVRRDGKLFLDVWKANTDQLTKAGLSPERMHVSRLCTACHPDWFYSYRREGPGTGRLAGFIRPQSRRA
jgi:YfiH family protein